MNFAIRNVDVFPLSDLLRFIGKLLVMQSALLRVGEILVKNSLRIVTGQRGHAVPIQRIHEIDVPGVSQRVLREDHMLFPFAGFIEQLRYPSAIVRAAHIDHPRPE